MSIKIKIEKTDDFDKWYKKQDQKSQGQIDDRLDRIAFEEHFGDVKDLGDGVYELKWKSGRRLYFSRIANTNVLCLLGGNKNGQNKDIKKAKNILFRRNAYSKA